MHQKIQEMSWVVRKRKKKNVNNSRALELEISKQKQYEELKKFNIAIPKTLYAKEKKEIIEKSKTFTKPFITKHNRGGRGLGVKFLKIQVNLKNMLTVDFEDSIDGITLLQEYIH